MTELLTRAVASLERHPAAGSPDLARIERGARRRRARRRIVAGTGVAALLALGGLGLVARGGGSLVVAGDGSLDVGGLAMTGSAGDFYRLDPAVVPDGWRERIDGDILRLAVCTAVEDRAGEPVCTETEGPAGVGQVDYLASGNDGATAQNQSGEAGAISVVTTHTAVTLDAYVERWTMPAKDAQPAVRAVVRDREARSYDTNGPGTPTLTWQEEPGLLVSVSGYRVDPAVVARVAESISLVDVDRLPIPTAVARVEGLAWAADDNNHPYLLAERRDGRTCVGFGFIDGCGQRAASRSVVRATAVGFTVLGSAPAEAARVEVLDAAGARIGEAATSSTPGFPDRFYAVPTGRTAPASVVLRAADGVELERFAPGAVPALPSSLPSIVDGVAVLADVAGGTTADGRGYRVSIVPPRTAANATGDPVAIDRCYVLETVDGNAAWCGEVTDTVVVRSGGVALTLGPAAGSALGDVSFGDNATDTVWAAGSVRDADPKSAPTSDVTTSFTDVTRTLTAG